MQLQRLYRKFVNLLRLLRPLELRLGRGECPLCGGGVLLRLQDSEAGTRCLRCRAGPVQMSIGALIRADIPRASRRSVYELSSRGSLFRFLERESDVVTGSEFMDGVEPGHWQGAVQCQNVEALTYEDASFDLCTSTDVFEHVADDAAGFRELYRVLKPGGAVVFTVPLTSAASTLERARLRDGEIQFLTEPEYHDDLLRGAGKVLAFRTYGQDILERLAAAGFADCRIDSRSVGRFMGYGRPVVFARKSSEACNGSSSAADGNQATTAAR